jgi:hypothetical protein
MTHSSSEAEFLAHLKKLDDVGARINTAIGAADSTMNPMAFGILGAPLAGICAAAQAIASDAITKASDAAADHYRRFHEMSLHIKTNDQVQGQTFDGIHNR